MALRWAEWRCWLARLLPGEATERSLDLHPGCAPDQSAAPELTSVSLSFPTYQRGLIAISADPSFLVGPQGPVTWRTSWGLCSYSQRVGMAPVQPWIFQIPVFQFSFRSLSPSPGPSGAS